MIYIVEDDEDIRRIVCYALGNAGYESKGFGESKDFWNEIKKELPSLVILDIMLPEENGLAILEKLRENNSTKNLPIIMLTATI